MWGMRGDRVGMIGDQCGNERGSVRLQTNTSLPEISASHFDKSCFQF